MNVEKLLDAYCLLEVYDVLKTVGRGVTMLRINMEPQQSILSWLHNQRRERKPRYGTCTNGFLLSSSEEKENPFPAQITNCAEVVVHDTIAAQCLGQHYEDAAG
ncbi:hypothetical protein OS493_026370 [Desmophyllum pertusum]|uniref:Uncharacterized protein n=1 Tax=Desmophyllum pertusum TaxID=174260 RepID=A0A9X0CXB3_9CNID|nr:hypothetical protein OS493_026370 [Desmophyllum pertusum]